MEHIRRMVDKRCVKQTLEAQNQMGEGFMKISKEMDEVGDRNKPKCRDTDEEKLKNNKLQSKIFVRQ
jgi:hypothetical protein